MTLATLYLSILLVMNGVLLVIAVIAYERPQVKGTRTISLLLILLLIWQAGYMLELVSPELAQKRFWDGVQWPMALAVGLAACHLGLIYNGRRLPRWLWSIPVVYAALLLIDPELTYVSPVLLDRPPFDALSYQMGPMGVIGVALIYGLLLAGILLLAVRYRRSRGRERMRAGIIGGGLAFSSGLALVMTTLGLTLMGQRDVGPLAGTLGGMVVFWGTLRYRLFDLLPVAYNVLFESMRDAVVIVDFEGRIINWNHVARSWARRPDVEGELATAFPEWQARLDAHRDQCSITTTVTMVLADESRTIDLRVMPLLNAQGRDSGKLIVGRDITQTAHLLDKLRQSEERLRIITDNAHDMIAFFDVQGAARYVSASFLAHLGYTEEQMLGTSGFEFVHPLDQTTMMSQLQTFLTDEKAPSFILFRAVTAEGDTVWLEASGAIVRDGNGKTDGIVAVFRDVSERRELEQLRLEQERLTGALQKQMELGDERRRMMTRIGHEFRTPLTIIQTSTYLMDRYREKMPEDQRASKTACIYEQIGYITRMLDSISDVVNDRLIPDATVIRRVRLADLCHEVVAEVNREHGIPQQVEITADSGLEVEANTDLLRIALTHVVVNASRFSPETGAIRIGVQLKDGAGMFVSVQDDGIGIPVNEQVLVFDPFYRGSNSDRLSGLGLGLTIARKALSALGGAIVLESEADQGTTVTLHLPQLSA
jgi:PAS domain S-box-containing protein